MSDWISVEDELPEQVYTDYIVWPHPMATYGDSYTAEYIGDGSWLINEEDSYSTYERQYSPTHWMPLPEPPKESKND